MDTYRGHSSLPRRLTEPVVAIGNFDGAHLGHAFIFHEARRLAAARQRQGETVVLTFEPHPAKVLAPTFAPPLITTPARKLELLAAAGIDVTVLEPFDRALAAMSAEEFVRQVLADGLGARQVVVGYDFTFGAKRSGDVRTLATLGQTHGFGVTVVPPVSVDGLVCSSTKVRELLLEGRVDGAALLLGREPEVEGEVVRGAGRGRTIGVPTANVASETELSPKNGVYAGWGERLSDGKRWGAAINIGTNPTFVNGNQVSIEAHLLDCDEDLYGQRLRLGFTQRLRDEKRYNSRDELVAQIGRDIEQARDCWSRARTG
ncbi:MAG TPA: bifunctional riboflavin kinase/FAD synthetase [Polyangia bacterium]|jgi:riboflavin kinase/FMN adenylyltransferase|nr:bifunctional riboflavin kinase/FAD synthetase [Polyangia bacterium]